MRHSTTDTYQLKREILFSKKMSRNTLKDIRKFTADMLYSILASKSCILSRFADTLWEGVQKKNTVESLSRKPRENLPTQLNHNYLSFVRKIVDGTGSVFVDDTDIIKPYGKASFDSLGRVRDGSSLNDAIENGYYVTEITALSKETRQPIRLYSHIHSVREGNYPSVNHVTFRGLRLAFAHFPQATYVFDRACDMNKLFKFMC